MLTLMMPGKDSLKKIQLFLSLFLSEKKLVFFSEIKLVVFFKTIFFAHK